MPSTNAQFSVTLADMNFAYINAPPGADNQFTMDFRSIEIDLGPTLKDQGTAVSGVTTDINNRARNAELGV